MKNWKLKISKPTKHKFWCKYCDMDLVGEYGKCRNCKKKNSKKYKQ